jgi:hypothetical protein
MAAQVYRILTTGISHEGLSDVTEKILSIVKERFTAQQPQIGPLVVKVQGEWVELKEALTRMFCSPLTPEIQTNHNQRVESIVAFHYLLRNKLKAGTKPEVVKAAQEVKAVLANSGLWKCSPKSHQYTSSLIANMIQVFSTPRYRGLLETLGMVEEFEELVACNRQYGSLQTQRFEEKAGVTTPTIVEAHKRLLQNLNTLVSLIAANASIDPAAFSAAAEQIGSAVREANAVTRSGQTRRENAVAAEQAEQAAASGQGSAGAGGGLQHATFPPQGIPVTSITPETNPAGPPTGKEALAA